MKNNWKTAGTVILTLACGLFILGSILWSHRYVSRRKDEQQFSVAFERVQKEVPLGTTRSSVEAYAAANHFSVSYSGSDLNLGLTKITSTEWFCSEWLGVAQIHFLSSLEEAPALGLTKTEFGVECL